MPLNKPSGSDVAKVTSYLRVQNELGSASFVSSLFLVAWFTYFPQDWGRMVKNTLQVSSTVVATTVLSSTTTPYQQAETLVMWRVYWVFGHALVTGESRLPADLSGGRMRLQNMLLCGKKQELDNSVLANTLHNFIDRSCFCGGSVLAFRKSDTSE
jgi:hypothetical protein